MRVCNGGHRLKAAISVGLTSIPFVLKPDGISNVAHAVNCNNDGATTKVYDVFDYANHCYVRAEAGWELKDIAKELGWGSEVKVSHYKDIKTKLHSKAWDLVKLTRNPNIVNPDGNSIVNQELTIVKWLESHFRALLTHLKNPTDNATMRAQLKTIRAAIAHVNPPKPKKVTAEWIGKEAQKHSWHVILAKYMRDNIIERATLIDRKKLLRSVCGGVFSSKTGTHLKVPLNFTNTPNLLAWVTQSA